MLWLIGSSHLGAEADLRRRPATFLKSPGVDERDGPLISAEGAVMDQRGQKTRSCTVFLSDTRHVVRAAHR